MAFLDNLGKKVSEAGQKTMQKTKEIADTSRLNSMISEEEKKINNNYFQIGKLYTSIHQKDYEEAFEGMINGIADSEEKIKDYKKQIQNIRGVMHCEKCGAEVPKDAAFCVACGTAIPKTQAIVDSEYMHCKSCGATVRKGMRFCTECGKPIELTVSEAEETSIVAEEVIEPVCPNCGTKLEAGAAFCMECGTKL